MLGWSPSQRRTVEVPLEIIIVGGGIGGLTLALTLHKAGIPSQVFEVAPELAPIGVGINILPHATRELALLGLEGALAAAAVTTRESAFFNRYGQLIYREPSGQHAGYDWPAILDPPRRSAARAARCLSATPRW